MAMRAGRTVAAACAAVLLSASAVLASASELTRDRLGDAGWSEGAINALLSVHADEFELDASSGWLPQRLEHLARLGRHPSALRMIEAFPEFTDLFANAAEPGALARVIGDLSLDRQETERLLNLFIGWPSRSEAAHLQRVLEAHGRTVMNFADTIHLYPVVEALVLAQAEQAPSAWRDWVAAELRRSARIGQVEETLVVIETQGRAIARRMETQPGFADEFPYLWTSFRELVETHSSEEERHTVLTGLLSHEGIWETLAEPFGTAALSRIEADWMPELLLALWGTDGWTQPVEATGRLFEHRGPMPAARRAWLLAELAADNELRRLSGE